MVRRATIATYGETQHSFIERHDYHGTFLPGIPGLLLTVLLLGAYYAATDGALMALASEIVPPELRTSGLALLTTGMSLARLLSSLLFDSDFRVQSSIDADGLPNRARLSPDGRYAAMTAFVNGDSYAIDRGFSTRTKLVDVNRGAVLSDLEEFRVSRNGQPLPRWLILRSAWRPGASTTRWSGSTTIASSTGTRIARSVPKMRSTSGRCRSTAPAHPRCTCPGPSRRPVSASS